MYLLEQLYLFNNLKTGPFTNINKGFLYSSAPVRHDSVIVPQHAQYQDHETEAAKMNSSIITPVLFLLWHAKIFFMKKVYKVRLGLGWNLKSEICAELHHEWAA